LRVRISVDARLCLDVGAPLVLAFWHGQQMLLLRWPQRRRLAVLVSLSQDGELQSGVLGAAGLHVIRGSSSKGGAAGLRRLIGALRGDERDAAFAVDGPRGPQRVVKPGALAAARLAGAVLVPLAAAASRAKVLGKTWDGFEIPLPFSRVAIVAGAPVPVDALHDTRAVGVAIEAARRRASALLDASPAPVSRPFDGGPRAL
jgi:hypothetical protein